MILKYHKMFLHSSVCIPLENWVGLKGIEMVVHLPVYSVLILKPLYVILVKRTGSFYDQISTFLLVFLAL